MALPKTPRETGSRAVGSREFVQFSPVITGETFTVPEDGFVHPSHRFLSSTYVEAGPIDILRLVLTVFPKAEVVLRSSRSWESIETTYVVIRIRPDEPYGFIVIDSKNGITCMHVIPCIIIDSIAVPIGPAVIAKHVPEAAWAWGRVWDAVTQEPISSSYDDEKVIEFFDTWRIPADYLPASIGDLRRVFAGLSTGAIPLDSGRKRQAVRSVAGAVKLAVEFADIFTGEKCTRF